MPAALRHKTAILLILLRDCFSMATPGIKNNNSGMTPDSGIKIDNFRWNYTQYCQNACTRYSHYTFCACEFSRQLLRATNLLLLSHIGHGIFANFHPLAFRMFIYAKRIQNRQLDWRWSLNINLLLWQFANFFGIQIESFSLGIKCISYGPMMQYA